MNMRYNEYADKKRFYPPFVARVKNDGLWIGASFFFYVFY